MLLEELSWPQVEEYLKTKKTILFPVGSTEQHGSIGLIGIDYISSRDIAKAVGEKTKTLVAPPLPFGMALHHMAFPGTMSLTPLTYIQVITELIDSLATHGFEEIIFINGHGGNIAPLTSALSEALQKHPKLQFQILNWWQIKEVQDYDTIHFKDEAGFHATVTEVSVTMYTHPAAYATQKAYEHFPSATRTSWPLSPSEFRKTFPDGRMGSNLKLASADHGKKVFDLVVQTIANKINN